MIYNISYKTLIGSKYLQVRFDKTDEITKIYDGIKYSTLFSTKKYDAIYDRIRCLISLKSSIPYIFSNYFAKIKVESYSSLSIEKQLTLYIVIILIKSVLNKDKNHHYYPTKHSSWWSRLQDVFKTSFVFVFRRRLEDVLVKTNIFVLVIRLQDVFKTSSRNIHNIFKTCWRRLQDIFKTPCQDVLQKRFQDIFETFSRHFEGVFKTSWKDIFKMFSRRIIKLNCSCSQAFETY